MTLQDVIEQGAELLRRRQVLLGILAVAIVSTLLLMDVQLHVFLDLKVGG